MYAFFCPIKYTQKHYSREISKKRDSNRFSKFLKLNKIATKGKEKAATSPMISLILCRLGCRFWLHTWLLKFYPAGVFHPFQPTAAFHTESSHLICNAKQMKYIYFWAEMG